MARTQEQVLAEMDAIQAGVPELAGLTSKSQTAFYASLKRMWALLVMSLETVFDRIVGEITAAINAQEIGTLRWYVNQAKLFQYGDPVIIDSGRVTYSEIDPTKKIVKQASAVEDAATGRLVFKVVKQSGSGLIPLNADELAAFKEYINDIKYAGVAVDVVSMYPEDVKLNCTVKLDRQVLTSDGASVTNPTSSVVVAAINKFLQQLPFDSVLRWTELTDYMQKVPGVDDFVITQSWQRFGNENLGQLNWTEFTGQYTSRAGHMRLVVGESTITYQ